MKISNPELAALWDERELSFDVETTGLRPFHGDVPFAAVLSTGVKSAYVDLTDGDALRELIEFGEQNDAIGEKMHRLTLALIAARDAEAAIQALYFHLREDFAVPHTVIRLWPQWDHPQTAEFAEVSMAARDFAASLANPYCCAKAMVDTAEWFGDDAQHLRSFAYVTLKNDETIGLLAMASEDAQRFYPEMGTLYLKRLGDLAAATLLRYLA